VRSARARPPAVPTGEPRALLGAQYGICAASRPRRTRAEKSPGPKGLHPGGRPVRCAARPMLRHRSSRRACRIAAPGRNAADSKLLGLALAKPVPTCNWRSQSGGAIRARNPPPLGRRSAARAC